MHSILKALWWARIYSFHRIWFAMTIAAISATWMVVAGGTPSPRNPMTDLESGTLKPRFIHLQRATTVLALALLAVFLAGYITVSVLAEKFAFYDDIQLTLHSLKGLSYAPPIWQDSGRFFPLGLQEFNLLKYFTRTIAGFHVLIIGELLILSCVLLGLDEELSIPGRAALIPVFLSAPGIVIAFTGLIYPERNFVFCLACLVLAVERFERTQSPVWAAGAAGCAQIMIYEKETASLLLLGFVLGRLLLRWWNAQQAGFDNRWLRSKDSRLDLCLASLAGLFLLYYMAAMYPHPNMKYADNVRLPPGVLFRSYLKLDLLVWIFVAVLLLRAYGILRRKLAPSPLWDGLGFGGLVCFGAYLHLGIFRAYDLAPVEAVAVWYVGRFVMMSWKEMRTGSRAVALGAACVVVIQYVSLSAFHVVERQNLLRAKAEIARVVEARYGQATQPVRLFFPYASPWQVLEFGYYLNLQGIPIENEGTSGAGGPGPVVMVSMAVANDGPCVKNWSIVCRAYPVPEPGDLVIVLPDDNAQLSQVTPYRKVGESLLSYERRPAIPEGLNSFIRLLGFASVPKAQKELPDRWLDASVTVWR